MSPTVPNAPPLAITFHPQASQEEWARVAAIVRLLPGVLRVDVAPAPPVERVGGAVKPAPKRGKNSEWWVANTLGVCIAELGDSELAASMMLVFVECQGVFTSVDVLFAVLHGQFPSVWTASHRNQVVPVYAQLRKKVAHSSYRLLPSGRGAYGLQGLEQKAIASAERVRLKKDPAVQIVDKRDAKRAIG